METVEEMNRYEPISAVEFDRRMSAHAVWLKTQGREGKQASFSYCQFPDGLPIENYLFSHVNFSHADLSKLSFRDCRFAFCDFTESNLNDVKVAGCIFSKECKLKNVTLDRAKFTGNTVVDASDFCPKSADDALFQDVAFNRAMMEQAKFHNSEFKNVQFIKCDLQKSSLSWCSFHHGCVFDHTPMDKLDGLRLALGDSQLIGCSMEALRLVGSDCNDATFEYCNMQKASIYHCNFERTCFKHGATPSPMVVLSVNLPEAGEVKSIACFPERGSVTSADVLGEGKELKIKDAVSMVKNGEFAEKYSPADLAMLGATLESLKAFSKSFSRQDTTPAVTHPSSIKEKIHAVLHH